MACGSNQKYARYEDRTHDLRIAGLYSPSYTTYETGALTSWANQAMDAEQNEWLL